MVSDELEQVRTVSVKDVDVVKFYKAYIVPTIVIVNSPTSVLDEESHVVSKSYV